MKGEKQLKRYYSNYSNYGNTSVNGIVIIILIIITILLSLSIENSNKHKIEDKISSMDGIVISVEDRTMKSDVFKWVNIKADRVYKFKYQIGDEGIKVGWVIFRTFETEWKLDWKEK